MDILTNNFKNEVVMTESFPSFQDIILTPISPKYLKVLLIQLTIISIISVVVMLSLLITFQKEIPFFLLIIIPIFFALLFLFIGIITYFGFSNRKYAVRDHDIIYQHGIIKKTTQIVPISRIQHTVLQQGWISRQFQLQSLAIFTAGSENGVMNIQGLEEEIALQKNQWILNKIQQRSKLKSEETYQAITRVDNSDLNE